MPNTDLGTNPTFSPDGQWIAFELGNVGGGIFRVPIAGGTPLPVVAQGGEPHWAQDDQIVYRSGRDILAVQASGGEPEILFRSDSMAPRRPHLLPGGRAVVFGTGGALTSRIMLYDLGTTDLRELSATGNQPRFAPTGHLLYGQGDGSLMAVPFDLETLATVGSPVTVLPSLSVYAAGASQFDVSNNGTLVYEAAFALSAERRLVWVERDGSEQLIDAPSQEYTFPRVSPDGRRAAVSVSRDERRADVYVWSFVNDNGMPLFLGEDIFSYPIWTSDGTRVAYSAASGGIYAKAANNTGSPELLVQVETGGDPSRQPSPYFFAPAQRAIVYRDQVTRTNDDLVMWSLEGDSVIWRLDGPFVERNAALSPNGRWMAYQSNESGQTEVYVRPFPNVHDDLVTISNAGGYDPVWSSDGRELFYLGEIDLVVVSVDPEASSGSFAFGDRRVLLPWPYFANSEGRNFDVAPNGRFLAIDARDETEQAVYIVTNWFEELRERVGN